MEHKRIYAKLDSPTRCQGIMKNGEQCCYEALPGKQFCSKHYRGLKREQKRMYELTQWTKRIKKFARHEESYTLREELGILRMQLETILKKCQNDDDLIRYNPQISDLVMKIERLVNQSVTLDKKLANLLEGNKVSDFAQAVVQAVQEGLAKTDLSKEQKKEIHENIAVGLEVAEQALLTPSFEDEET